MFSHQQNDGSHEFFPDTSFDLIVNEYHFNKNLRLLVLEYIERIEVALRAQLSNIFCIDHGFFWYSNRDLYQDTSVYGQINDYISEYFDDPPDIFLKKYKAKYTNEPLPPSNMAFEILTFGKLSRLYTGLKNDAEKQKIAKHFYLPSTILSSWFVYLTNVRNICAHYSRLWNRKITADRPTIPTREKYKFHGILPESFNSSIYGIASLIERLLRPINPSNSFIEKLTTLIDDNPNIDIRKMGIPLNWKEEPAWKENP